jgi:(2Fe-2S) ferredoxin
MPLQTHAPASMSYYHKHVFFCTNQRAGGEACCNNFGASHMRDYMKEKVKSLNLSNDHNRIRINSAGCMNRCDEGPAIVIYPEGVWYTWVDESDVDEIIEQHLEHGRVVERLRI